MTHVEVKAWVDENLKRKMKEFGVPHWRIDVSFERIEGDCVMNCTSYPERERASICVDSAAFASDESAAEEQGLEHCLEHELLHVVHSPFELVRHHLWRLLDDHTYNAVSSLFSDCCELTVRNMERMAYGLRNVKEPGADPT